MLLRLAACKLTHYSTPSSNDRFFCTIAVGASRTADAIRRAFFRITGAWSRCYFSGLSSRNDSGTQKWR
jgi:hypothetical protein